MEEYVNSVAENQSPQNGGNESKKDKRKLTKREKGKIALIVVGSFFGLIALLVVILAPIIAVGNKAIVRDTVEPNQMLTQWMSYISDDTPITDMAIPGSHDSGCYDMPWYAETQDLTFAEQLARGVRYFDIRVNNSRDGYVVFHGPVNGVDYEDLLRDIDEFMDANPTEFLILDFSHFKNDSESKVFEMFDEIVGAARLVNDSELSDDEFLDSLTLGDVRGKCIVFVDPDETSFRDRPYLFLRANDKSEYPCASLTSPYKKLWNGSSAKKFAGEILDRYFDEFSKYDSGFFVLQCQLTDNALVFGPRYREGKLIDLANDYIADLYSDTAKLPYVNIIMRDFVTCEKTALVIRLNEAKGYVAEEHRAEFVAAMNGFACME